MNIAVATSTKAQDWESQKVSALDMEPSLATRVRGVAGHGDGKDTHGLLEQRGHGRKEAVHSYAVSTPDRFSVFEKRGEKRAE